MSHKVIPFISALLTVVFLFAFTVPLKASPSPAKVISSPGYFEETIQELPPPDFHPIADFTRVAERVSLQELINYMAEHGMTLYLPTQLPNGLKLTAVWLKDGPFVAMIVYDRHAETDPYLAELVIELYPTPLTAYGGRSELEKHLKEVYGDEYGKRIKTLEVNGWFVVIDEKAPCGAPRTVEKFGPYVLYVRVWIEEVEYRIVAHTLTVEEVVQLIQNMKPTEA